MFGKFTEKIEQYMEQINQFMRKMEASIQNQGASIKNLETQIGQMEVAISSRALGTLPSNTEVNPKEYVKAITTKSGVQLPEIYVKRLVANKERISSTGQSGTDWA
ncbi:Uncharacterized protein Adt_11491 [Abeliophyllum distichum]|uniref:Uncharacterized protein n=1 Tax=Abeliophyllum distichum TaxID=126358 RepID=A0ABD1UMZ5_9LAMI